MKDFEPITLVASLPFNVLIVSRILGVNNVAELICRQERPEQT